MPVCEGERRAGAAGWGQRSSSAHAGLESKARGSLGSCSMCTDRTAVSPAQKAHAACALHQQCSTRRCSVACNVCSSTRRPNRQRASAPMPEPTPTPAPMSDTRAMMLRLTLTSWESTMAAAAAAVDSCCCASASGPAAAQVQRERAAGGKLGGGPGGAPGRRLELTKAAHSSRNTGTESNWPEKQQQPLGARPGRRPHLRRVQLLTLCTATLQVRGHGREGPAGQRSGGTVAACSAAGLGGPADRVDAT